MSTTAIVPASRVPESNGVPAAYRPQSPAMSFDEMQQLAVAVKNSGLFACRTVEQALTLMMLSQAEGLHPIVAMRQYHIIEGRPSMRADAMQARFEERGGRVEWAERTNEACEATFHFPGKSSVPVRWTMADARQASLAGKDNWKKYPRNMLSARVISEGVRAQCPAVVCGVYSPEEVQDFDPPRGGAGGQHESPRATEPPGEPPVVVASAAQVSRLAELVNDPRLPNGPELVGKWLGHAGVQYVEDLTAEQIEKCIRLAEERVQHADQVSQALDHGGADAQAGHNPSAESPSVPAPSPGPAPAPAATFNAPADPGPPERRIDPSDGNDEDPRAAYDRWLEDVRGVALAGDPDEQKFKNALKKWQLKDAAVTQPWKLKPESRRQIAQDVMEARGHFAYLPGAAAAEAATNNR